MEVVDIMKKVYIFNLSEIGKNYEEILRKILKNYRKYLLCINF